MDSCTNICLLRLFSERFPSTNVQIPQSTTVKTFHRRWRWRRHFLSAVKRRRLFHKEVHKKWFMCIFNIANCGHNPIPAVKGDVHLDRCSTVRQVGTEHTCVWTAEGRRKEKGASRPPFKLWRYDCEFMKFLIYSLKAKTCPSCVKWNVSALWVKEINTINKNRLMQVANRFRIIHTESIDGKINMEKLLLMHLR